MRAVLWCSCVRLRPTKVDHGRGTGSVPSTKVDPGGGSGGAFGPQTTREAVADDLLHAVHTTHAITKATVAAMRSLTRIERRLRGGRRENQPIAALIRLTKFLDPDGVDKKSHR